MPKDAPRPIRLPDDAWRRPEVIRHCRDRDADALFRLARKHGCTNEAIGYWTGIDPAEVSKRISGAKGPVRTLDRWHRIADGLGMPDHARHAVGIAARDAPAAALDRDTRTAPSRRSVIDPQLPPTLLDLLAQYARTDNLVGPRSLLVAVTAQLTLIEQLWKAAPDPVRSHLFEVGARYAEFAGWLHQDAGDAAAAARWTLHALELAHAAGMPGLVAYVLMRRSNQESTGGDGSRALGLAAAALDEPSARDPGLRALILRQRARGHALTGDIAACQRALDEARDQAASVPDDPDPKESALTGYCTPSYVEMEAADCWLILGRPERAAPIFEAELSRWPEVYRRDRAVHLARLASAYAACERVDDAENAASEALVMAEEVGSFRAVEEIDRSLRRLSGTRTAPDVGPLRERLSVLTAAG